jgi:bifunctional N-acetylglucosamine-1-phosphate-uridyltransferase/glucosamine-1-phosphate-acetyltransferase GlmU-like protein
MNILILAAGKEPSESAASSYPLWLSEIDGELLIERQVQNLSALDKAHFVFMFRQADVQAYFLNDIVSQMVPDGVVLGINHETAGAACTALLAAGAIDMEDELLVVSASDHLDVDIGELVYRFRREGADAGLLTFKSLHPRYSFVRVERGGWVVETAEKRPISRLASAGAYWFRRADDFFDAVREMILKDDHVQGSFYICPALNQMILQHKKVLAVEISQQQYHPLKSDRQISDLENSLFEGRADDAA